MKWLILLIAMALPTGTNYADVTLPNPNSDLTDSVIVVDLSDMPADWWNAVDTSDGTRGRASKDDAAEDAATELAVEWVDFDDTAETGFAWVKWSGTNSATASETIRIYPPVSGNASVAVGGTFGRDAVWSDYEAVFHLNEDPSGTAPQFADATGNGHDATSNGTMTSADNISTSPLGGGLEFDGSDDYLEMATPVIVNAGDTSINAYHNKYSNNNSGPHFLSTENKTDPQFPYDIQHLRFTNHLDFRYDNDLYRFTLGFSANTWFKTTFTIDSSFNVRAYSDGSGLVENPIAGVDANIEFSVIGSRGLGDVPYQGRLDEIRFANFEISADWDAYEYSNQNDISTFWGTWTWQGGGGGVSLTPGDLSHAHSLAQTSVDVGYGLTASDIAHTHNLAQSGVTVLYSLSPNGVQHAHSLDQASLTPHYVFTAADISHAHQLDQTTLGQLYNLTPDGLSHTHNLDGASISVLYGLSPDALEHGHSLASAALTPHYVITPADLQHNHELAEAILGITGDATKVSLAANELYVINLQARKLYRVSLAENELYHITLNANEVID